jgi:hypothetical protein
MLLYYSPGQRATIFLETLDGYGYGTRADTVFTPTIDRVIFPNLSLADDFPQDMVKLDTGLYYYQITLPTGADAVGSYLIDASYLRNVDGYTDGYYNIQAYQILVTSPFGNYNASVSI